jgi:prephenate dehydrogenase
MEAHFTNARVLVAGLGLIGGSVAKAFRQAGLKHIDGLETNPSTLASAQEEGVISGDFHTNGNYYDIVICSLTPQMVPELYDQVKDRLMAGGVFAELSGLKAGVTRTLVPALAGNHELLCLHPMAGSEKSGYAHSDTALFQGAALIMTPTEKTGDYALGWADFLFRALGCSSMPTIPADTHDRLIADMSHLPHIIALAMRALGKENEVFAGGSYRSVTRVADINAPLWAGLLTDNAEYLLESIDRFRANLDILEAAVHAHDTAALEKLLRRISDSGAKEDS